MKRFFLALCMGAVLLFENYSPVYAAPDTSAKAYIVMDALTRTVIFEGSARETLPMASTTKIMSALLCLESGDLDSEFVVDSDAIKVEGSSMGLQDGDIVSKSDLCIGMLLPSGNDAAGAVAVKLSGSYPAFADMMNSRAAEIGMADTHFVTPSGLHDDNHYSTAYDMALLTAEALENEDFREICSQKAMKLTFGNPPYDRRLYNSNKLLEMYDGVIGVKTGFTDEAGRCLVSACERDGAVLICVTLNDKDDWNDHIRLYEAAFSETKAVEIYSPTDIAVPVAGSDRESVPIYSKNRLICRVPAGYELSAQWHIESAPFLYAPVGRDDIAGELVHTLEGREISRQPLFAKESAALK